MQNYLRVANGLCEFAKHSSLPDPKTCPFLSCENINSGSWLVPPHLRNGGFVVCENGGDLGHASYGWLFKSCIGGAKYSYLSMRLKKKRERTFGL